MGTIKVRQGKIRLRIQRPIWLYRINVYPRYDPRYRLLLRLYMNALPVMPELLSEAGFSGFIGFSGLGIGVRNPSHNRTTPNYSLENLASEIKGRYNMDKQGNILTGRENEFLRSFSEKDEEEAPRKVTLSEYLSSPEFQRQQKIASEQAQRSAFEKKMAFRSAQEQNPIKGRPRRKRGRKVR